MNSGIIFDMDGCVIDSKEVQKRALLESYRIVVGDDNCPAYEEYVKHTGDSIDNVLLKLGLPIEMAPLYCQISRDAVSSIEINWDLINLIKECKKKGFSIAICTGKDHERAEEILRFYNIQNLFDVVVGADEVANPKPNPESVLYAINKMNVEKARVIMVGDGLNDILCAKNAGIKSVLSRWYEDEVCIEGADYIIYSVSELYDILSELHLLKYENCL